METIIDELVALAEQGHALSDETLLGINQFDEIQNKLKQKASQLFDSPLSLLPRGNIGFFHRVHRRGGDEDSLAAGLMPISKIEVDTMALDELLDLVRNEKLAAESPQVLNMLPENVHAWVTSAAFEQECNEKFMDLDADRAGILGAADVFPVVCSLTAGSPLAVTEHHVADYRRLRLERQRGHRPGRVRGLHSLPHRRHVRGHKKRGPPTGTRAKATAPRARTRPRRTSSSGATSSA